MSNVFNTLAPIGLLILAGALLRQGHFAPSGFFRDLNRLVYWVALPALLLEKTAQVRSGGGDALRILGLLLTVTAICVLLGYLAVWWRRIPSAAAGTFVQGAFRGNLAYIGLPVLLFSMAGQPPEAVLAIETAAVLAMAPLIPTYNILAVLVLLAGRTVTDQRTRPRAILGHAIRNVLTNPLLLACATGALLAAGGISLPAFAQRGLSAAGQMALPLSLLAIGASLTVGTLGQQLPRALGSASIKVLIAPLIGLLLGGCFGLSGLSLRVAMIFLACPTAVASYVMADQLGGDADLAGGIVALTTAMALPGLALVLILT